MRKSVKMILFLVLAVFVLAVIALVFAANYMFTYALDSQFGGGAKDHQQYQQPQRQ